MRHLIKIDSGKIIPYDKSKFETELQKYDEQTIYLTFSTIRKQRTLPQNKYFHGVIVKYFAEVMGEDPDTVKQLLLEKVFGTISIKRGGFHYQKLIKPHTSELSTVEFETLCRRSREIASEFFNLYIPQPNEPENYVIDKSKKPKD